MNWYLAALKKYAVFNGRAGRKEYWFFALFVFLIYLALGLIDKVIGITHKGEGVGLSSGLFTLAMFLPGIGVGIRRLHDTGRSGWWLLVALIPLVGTIFMLILMALKGNTGANAYGPEPSDEIVEIL